MPIRLHERLSEFSYGYGATREVEILLDMVGLRATPFLPSLIHEAEVGFDVAFGLRGKPLLLQFKLGEELKRFHKVNPAQTIPALSRPFWRYSIDTSEHQFQRLRDFEDAGCDAYYVAPKFSSWRQFDRAFRRSMVLDHSLLVRPREIERAIIAQGAAIGRHRVVYDSARHYVCSEPFRINAEEPAELAGKLSADIQNGRPLGVEVEEIYLRQTERRSLGRIPDAERQEILSKSRSKIEGMAAVIALEAWTLGTQVIFATIQPE